MPDGIVDEGVISAESFFDSEEITIDDIKLPDAESVFGEDETDDTPTDETHEEESEGEAEVAKAEEGETEEQLETDETPQDSKDSDSSEEEAEQPEASETEEINQDQIFQELSENTGVEISDPNQLVGALKELAELRTNKYAGLSEGLQKAIEYEQKGGDAGHFFQINSLDYDKMDGKSVLMHKYQREHSELYKADPELAKMKFEQEYRLKYGILDKSFDDELDEEDFKDENADEIKIAEKSLEYDINQARSEMNSLKVSDLKIEEKNDETGLTESEENVIGDQYESSLKQFMDEFDSIPVNIGGDKSFNLGVTGETLDKAKEDLNNPSQFLEKIGITNKGIDASKLAPVILWQHSYNNVGELLKNFISENQEKDSVEKIVENTSTDKTTGGSGSERSLLDQIGDAFQDKFGGIN